MRRLADSFEQLGLDPGFVAWSASRVDLAEVWEHCPRGDWLLALAIRVGVPRPLVVVAAADCVRMAQRFLPPGETRPERALEAALAWTRGAVTGAECWAAAFHAWGAATDLDESDESAADAARAAACVAFASDAAADDAYYASRAHAAEAALLAARAYRNTRVDAHAVCAELVRSRIELAEVVSRVDPALRSSLPPPPPDPDTDPMELTPHWFDPEHATS